MSDTLLVSKTVEQRQQETLRKSEVLSQRVWDNREVLPSVVLKGDPDVSTTTTTYTVDYGPKVLEAPGQGDDASVNGALVNGNDDKKHLVSRKKTEHTTQQITTTTKVIREFHHIGPNGELIDDQVLEYPETTTQATYNHLPNQSRYAMDSYRPHSPSSDAGSRGQYEGYGQAPYNYESYSQRPHEEYYGYAPSQGQGSGGAAPAHYRDASGHEYPVSGYAELDGGLMPPTSQEIYRNTSSPGLHAVPADRYDGSFEMTGSLGMPSSDTTAVGAEGGLASEGGYAALPEDMRHDRKGYYSLRREDSPYGAVRREEPTYSTDALRHEDALGYGTDALRREEALGYGTDALRREEALGYSTDALRREEALGYGTDAVYGVSESEIYGRMRADAFVPNGNADFDPRTIDGEHHLTPMPQVPPIQAQLLPPQMAIQTPLSHASPGQTTPNHYGDLYGPGHLRSPSVDSTSRVRWRGPDLHEVIDFLSNPNNVVKANAAAYLQHLCYMDDSTKQKARILGGIPPLVSLLSHDLPDLHRNACGALRNLSYGRQNDENKRAIKDAGGIPSLVRLLHKTQDNEVKELVTGILWNLSSSEELKQNILDDALGVLCSRIVIPCSGWGGGEVERDPNSDVWWSIVFKNASGVIRNISSAGQYARTKLRQCPGLVDSLFCVIKLAIQGNSHDNKSVENCVCILRNLSYRCQEVEDPNYDKNQLPVQSRATATDKGDNLGCFGGSRKKREMVGNQLKETNSGIRHTSHRGQAVRGMELLWQPEVVVGPYLSLLSDCSNPETLEAAAGAIQNLAACYWQPSIDVRAAVRKEKGLPILVELLRMEVDRVVCAVAAALRNLAIDQRNKELIGKYAMRDLVQKLPAANTHDPNTSDETIAAVLATLNEVIKKSAEFSRSLLEAGGVDRLNYITKQRVRYAARVVKFASQVLFSMWSHQELREVYKKSGWKEQDFVSKSVAARSAAGVGSHSPTANNTLNRPMASQGGTRYEDRTIQRSSQPKPQYLRREEVPLADLGYGGDGTQQGGGRMYQASMQLKPGEPVYAKVNREKKRSRQFDGAFYGTSDEWVESPPAYTPTHLTSSPNYAEPHSYAGAESAETNNNMLHVAEPAGDSWV